ncbi:MAG: hypothetical protein LQ349_001839 [Xanthoria aureola]|nr:MAG: hypothetical protein LQ349_001839 [Xanthoria aureola]
MEDNNADLEIFRKQWQEEVTARSTAKAQIPTRIRSHSSHERPDKSKAKAALPPSNVLSEEAELVDGIRTQAYHDLEDKDDIRRLGVEGSKHPQSSQMPKEPQSALEHYEKAIEREDQGNLGDSLNLYRKAYRLDASVDRIYRNKHFPPSKPKIKPTDPNPPNAPVTVPNTAHHSLDGPSTSTIHDLIASFSNTTVPAAAPPIEGTPPPGCHIARVPSEILIEILLRTAIADVASFARLSIVCKRFAFLVATEDRIWERLCQGREYGFAAMHYIWKTNIAGKPLTETLLETSDLPPENPLDISTLKITHSFTSSTVPVQSSPILSLSAAYPSYRQMLRTRPRLRFNGCYISTVNYHRPGASNTSTNSTYTCPVHIVTYYRYLRFFRDGTCLSLLTTTEPADVVHHLTKENLQAHHNKESMLPSAIMRHALKGRWRLSGSLDYQHDDMEKEGDVHIETEGVDAKYMYKMQLSLRSAGRAGGTRNNKLAWKGFWFYNRLTDDWATFTLRNDRAFFWSRVKSYAMGW